MTDVPQTGFLPNLEESSKIAKKIQDFSFGKISFGAILAIQAGCELGGGGVKKSVNLFDLLGGLVNAVEGVPLLDRQKDAITNAAGLIEVLAEKEQTIGGEMHDEATRLGPHLNRVLEYFAEKENQSAEELTQLKGKAQKAAGLAASMSARHARTLRENIIPLFRELAAALNIPFNPPQKHGQKR